VKDKFFYITIAIFVLTLGITGFLYYQLSQTTVTEYDSNFVDVRNEVITQIDTLSGTLNTAEDSDTVDTQIQALVTKKEAFQQMFDEAKKPSTNPEAIVNANQDFLTKTQEIIDTATEYKASFDETTVDPVEKMNEYNTKVGELNQIIDQIKSILEQNDSGIFLGLF